LKRFNLWLILSKIMKITKETIQKFNIKGPRYTSYPTVPEWGNQVQFLDLQRHLAQFSQADKPLSLYIHIPFCKTKCYFCGCHSIAEKTQDNTASYIDLLNQELGIIKKSFSKKHRLSALHLGGGTPTFLTGEELEKLMEHVHQAFTFEDQAEISMEIDPRTLQNNKLETIQKLGFNRLSFGIQDFNHDIQKAINRLQPYDLVATVMADARRLCFNAINFDLIYGLPGQTTDNFKDTVDKVLTLSPDRIALYSYAHIPSVIPIQTHIKNEDLPSAEAKLDIFLNSRKTLLDNGYQAIAMDHFAKKTDSMAIAPQNGTLFRHFMGYTLKQSDDWIGIGVSAISFVENAYFQNQKDMDTYTSSIAEEKIPVIRGFILNLDDQIRQMNWKNEQPFYAPTNPSGQRDPMQSSQPVEPN